jgi:putative nucleotidyltransferase with HDIG domain
MSGAIATVVPAELVRGIARMDPLPVTAQRLVDMMSGNEVALSKIVDLIEFDQAIAALVLRHAATTRYASHGTPTVRDAVMRIGTVALLEIVLDGYLNKLRVATPLYDLSEHDLWLHGAAARLAVRALREACPQVKMPVLAETAALLHDIGKLVVCRYLKCDVRDVLSYAKTHGTTFVEAERALLGTDHAAVGAAIAGHWKFPEEVADAIARHHSAPFVNPTVLLDAVAMANVVAKTVEAGLGAEGLNFNVDPQSYRRLGVDFTTFGRVCLQVDTELRELARTNGIAL